MSPPNYNRNIGKLAASRFDFEDHLKGINPTGFTNFRHTADQIDVSPAIIGTATNVEDSLTNIASFIAAQANIGQGFITVGDGYDTWHNANGTINFDNTVPSLDLLLNPIFNAIIAGSGLPAQYSRIKFGGIVLIKAGTYIITNTINLPPGIVLIGEGYGTKIINATSLNLSSLPPSQKFVPTTLPLFNIVSDPNRLNNDAAIDPNMFMFSRTTKIFNMVIADNFVEPTILGDTFYKLPQNKSGVKPLILQQPGSNLELENVYLIGRVNFSSGQTVSQATTYAVAINTSSPSSTGTLLKLNKCFVDGFSQPISFATTAGSNDYLNISDSKIRGYGYLTGDNVNPQNNCIFNSNICNININDSYLYGNSGNITSTLYLNALPTGSAPLLQNLSRINVSDNNIAINRLTGSSTLSNYQHLRKNTSITQANFILYATADASNNNINYDGTNSFKILLDGYATPQLSVSNNLITLSPNYNLSAVNITPTGNSPSVLINPTGTTPTVSISPTGTSASILLSPSGTNSSVVIAPSGSGSSFSISGTGNSTISTSNAVLNLQTSGSGHVNINSNFINLTGNSIFMTGSIKGDTGFNSPLNFELNTISLTGVGATLTLANSQYNTQTISFTGTLSNDVNVVFPTVSGYSKLIDASYTGNFSILLKTAGQAIPVAIYPGQKTWIYCDGTNIIKASANNIIATNQYATTSFQGYQSAISVQNNNASYTTGSATVSISFNNTRAGDILQIYGSALVSVPTGGSSSFIIQVIDGSGTNNLPESEARAYDNSTQFYPVSFYGQRILTGAGTFTTTAQIAMRLLTGTGNTFLYSPISLTGTLIRP